MRLLAFDTAGDSCSVGVFEIPPARPTPHTIVMRRRDGARGHAEHLPPLIAAVLDEAGLDIETLDAIATSRGPGSFAGIRTSIAAARGLALATGLRVFGPTTLESLAAGARAVDAGGDRPILVVVDGRRRQVFAQAFDAGGEPRSEPQPFAPEAAARLVSRGTRLVGCGAAQVRQHLTDPDRADLLPLAMDAQAVAQAASLMASRGQQPLSGFDLHPLYLRDADARADAGRALLQVGS